MANNILNKIFNLKNGLVPDIRTTAKVKSLLNTESEYNPFLDKHGNLINKFINYQAVLDNPNVTQKAKEYITKATGLTPTTVSAKVQEVNIKSPVISGTAIRSGTETSNTASSDFINPLDTMNITSPFGMRTHPIDKVQKMHYGIDLAASAGTPVKSSIGGKVVFAGDKNDGYGISVYVDNGNGTVTRYSHLQSANVKTGDTVTQGQIVGKVGSTGKATGPHLDFGVMINGKYVDPKQYLK